MHPLSRQIPWLHPFNETCHQLQRMQKMLTYCDISMFQGPATLGHMFAKE